MDNIDLTVTVTPEIVNTYPTLAKAIDDAVLYAYSKCFDRCLEDVIGYALKMYHTLGRTDVDQCGEMLGSTIAMEVGFALDKKLTGPALREVFVKAVVDAWTMQWEGTQSL